MFSPQFVVGFPDSSVGKESGYNEGDLDSIPESGRSPGEGNGNPLQYSCLENPMDRGAWRATVCGGTKSQHSWATNTFTFSLHMQLLNWQIHSSQSPSIGGWKWLSACEKDSKKSSHANLNPKPGAKNTVWQWHSSVTWVAWGLEICVLVANVHIL